jgi:hypothetical protein
LIWQTTEFLASNQSSRVIAQAITVDDHGDAYLFYSILHNWIFAQRKDHLVKIDGVTAKVVWDVQCTNGTDSIDRPRAALSFDATNGYLRLKGRLYDIQKREAVYFIDLRSSDTGQLLATSHLRSAYAESSPNSAVYRTDMYRIRSTNRHEYGTDTSLTLVDGAVICKNWCEDGTFLKATTPTTSYPAACPGLSWSLSHHNHRQLVCTYYYGRVSSIGVLIIYLFPLFFIVWMASSQQYRFRAQLWPHLHSHLMSPISLQLSSPIAFISWISSDEPR